MGIGLGFGFGLGFGLRLDVVGARVRVRITVTVNIPNERGDCGREARPEVAAQHGRVCGGGVPAAAGVP